MARSNGTGRTKKRGNCFLTCFVVNIVITVIFVVGVAVAANVLFNQKISPLIGGVTLKEALSILKDVYGGKEIQPDYTEADLESFYSGMSSALFLSDYSAEELQFQLLTDDSLAQLSADMASSAPSGAGEETAGEEDALYQYFASLTALQRYAYLTEEQRTAISQEQFTALADEAQASLRKALGLSLCRISLTNIIEGLDLGSEDGDTAEDVSSNGDKLINSILSELEFNFAALDDYDINNADAEGNLAFSSVSLSGKEVGALINEIVSVLMSSYDQEMSEKIDEILPADSKITDYISIPSVTIKNTPLATSGEEALYDQKDTELALTISINVRELAADVMSEMSETTPALQKIPGFAYSIICKMLPKFINLSASIYPLAEEGDNRSLNIRFNDASEKNIGNIHKIVNGLMNMNSDDSEETDGSETESENSNFVNDYLVNINNKVVEVFEKIQTHVEINFVAEVDSEGNALTDSSGNTVSELRIMTFGTLLSLMKVGDTLTDHDLLTMLKCLYISSPRTAFDSAEALTGFKSDLSAKYGVNSTYLETANILDSDTLSGLVNEIQLSDGNIDYSGAVEDMRVELSSEALSALLLDLIENGAADVSSAGEEEDGGDDFLSSLDFNVSSLTVSKISSSTVSMITTSLFSFEIVIAVNIADLISSQLSNDTGEEDSGESNEMLTSLLPKLLPQGDTYVGVTLYIQETEDANGTITRKIGSAISEAHVAGLIINDFSAAETARVITTVNNLMLALNGESAFDFSSISSKIEDTLSSVFDSMSAADGLNLTVRMLGKNPENSADYGGILLPSIYELISGVLKSKLAEGETFTPSDAQETLRLIYASDADKSVHYTAEDSDNFFNLLNDRYYISYSGQIQSTDLFGDDGTESGTGSLGDKVGVDSIYFKYNATEDSLWKAENATYTKPSLYTDLRSGDSLEVPMTGAALAAILNQSGMLTLDNAFISSLSTLGCDVSYESGKIYVTFNMLAIIDKTSVSGDSEGFNASALLPNDIKLGAKVLMYAEDYTEEARFNTLLTVNDGDVGKLFMLISALGSGEETFDSSSLTSTVSDVLSSTFDALEANVNINYLNGSACYTYNDGESNVNCLMFGDVFDTLLKLMPGIVDIYAEDGTSLAESVAVNSESLMTKMREFGREPYTNVKEEADVSQWEVDINGIDTFFEETDLTSFLDTFEDNYYLNIELNADDLMGDAASLTVDSNSINFRGANGLYLDTRAVEELAVAVSGKALGALINDTQSTDGLISLGEDSTNAARLLQCKVDIDDNGTVEIEDDDAYLIIALMIELDDSELAMLPGYIFITATANLGYDFVSGSFPADIECTTAVQINNLSIGKTKNFLGYLSGLGATLPADLSVDNIGTTISDMLESGLEAMLSLMPAGSVSLADEAIVLPDVFSYLIADTTMTDIGDTATSASALATRLRGFGEQLWSGNDPDNTAVTGWINGMNFFEQGGYSLAYAWQLEAEYFTRSGTAPDYTYTSVGTIQEAEFTADTYYLYTTGDDEVVYTDMQSTYFMSSTPTSDGIFGGEMFNAITDSSFNLAGEEGLYLYDGEIQELQISDKALGVIIVENSSTAGIVSGESMSVEIVSLKIYYDELSNLVFETGVKIAFGGTAYAMMPDYFFVKAYTVKDSLSSAFTTTIAINNQEIEETSNLFRNLSSLSAIGMKVSGFNLTTICSQVNSIIENALTTMGANFEINYGEYAEGEIGTEGYGYMEFPSIYRLLINLIYGSSETVPTDINMQHMLNKLYEENITSSLVVNPMSDSAYYTSGINYLDQNTIGNFYSDRMVAYNLASSLDGETVNGDMQLSISQVIILGQNSTFADLRVWEERFYGEGCAIGSLDITTSSYTIVTASLDLTAYSSGSSTSLLPDEMFISILINMTDSGAQTLTVLYDMNDTDMSIFTDIISANVDNSGFNINTVANELANLVRDSLEDLAGAGAVIEYCDIADSNVYYTTLPDAINETNGIDVSIAMTGEGIGYIKISHSA